MRTLIDTNVLSEMLRADPDDSVALWFAHQDAAALFTSAVTQAEMLLGARLLPAGRRRAALESAIHALFAEDLANRVIAFDERAVPSYVDIVVARRASGRPIAQFDAQIAAIARSQRMSVATRDTAGFAGCGIGLVDPWAFVSH